MIDEERINYIGSMVLGINDAIVEITGRIDNRNSSFAFNGFF